MKSYCSFSSKSSHKYSNVSFSFSRGIKLTTVLAASDIILRIASSLPVHSAVINLDEERDFCVAGCGEKISEATNAAELRIR